MTKHLRTIASASREHVQVICKIELGARKWTENQRQPTLETLDHCNFHTAKIARQGASSQVISHQVITGEQGKKYCETLSAPFEHHDSEFSGGGADRENKY